MASQLQLQEEFKEYAEKAKSLPPSTKDADKLVLYGLYKQATVGDVNTGRPGFFSPTERAKWDAWKAVESRLASPDLNLGINQAWYSLLFVDVTEKNKEEAMGEYIEKVKHLQEHIHA